MDRWPNYADFGDGLARAWAALDPRSPTDHRRLLLLISIVGGAVLAVFQAVRLPLESGTAIRIAFIWLSSFLALLLWGSFPILIGKILYGWDFRTGKNWRAVGLSLPLIATCVAIILSAF
ncbi:MAG: hypothetical protein ACR2K5_16880 [Pseudolabrys sp.]